MGSVTVSFRPKPKHSKITTTHPVASTWLNRWSRAWGRTGTCSRDRRRGFGSLFNLAARCLLLLLLLGLTTQPLLLSPLSVLLLFLLGDVLKAGLDASCAAGT